MVAVPAGAPLRLLALLGGSGQGALHGQVHLATGVVMPAEAERLALGWLRLSPRAVLGCLTAPSQQRGWSTKNAKMTSLDAAAKSPPGQPGHLCRGLGRRSDDGSGVLKGA